MPSALEKNQKHKRHIYSLLISRTDEFDSFYSFTTRGNKSLFLLHTTTTFYYDGGMPR